MLHVLMSDGAAPQTKQAVNIFADKRASGLLKISDFFLYKKFLTLAPLTLETRTKVSMHERDMPLWIFNSHGFYPGKEKSYSRMMD